MLSTHNLQFAYKNNVNNAFVFQDFRATAALPLLVVGASGTGKTTLLHILGGLLVPTAGSVCLHSTDITQLDARALDDFRGKNIGIITQKNYFIGALTVAQNIAAAAYFSKKKPDAAHQTYQANLLQHLQLNDKLHRLPHTLSTGEQQRVCIARALVAAPTLLLADEPTSGLDDKNCQAVIEILQEQCQRIGTTLVVVTHDARLKAHFHNYIQT
jgi:putative ABC transport system ATP-binding protein